MDNNKVLCFGEILYRLQAKDEHFLIPTNPLYTLIQAVLKPT